MPSNPGEYLNELLLQLALCPADNLRRFDALDREIWISLSASGWIRRAYFELLIDKDKGFLFGDIENEVLAALCGDWRRGKTTQLSYKYVRERVRTTYKKLRGRPYTDINSLQLAGAGGPVIQYSTDELNQLIQKFRDTLEVRDQAILDAITNQIWVKEKTVWRNLTRMCDELNQMRKQLARLGATREPAKPFENNDVKRVVDRLLYHLELTTPPKSKKRSRGRGQDVQASETTEPLLDHEQLAADDLANSGIEKSETREPRVDREPLAPDDPPRQSQASERAEPAVEPEQLPDASAISGGQESQPHGPGNYDRATLLADLRRAAARRRGLMRLINAIASGQELPVIREHAKLSHKEFAQRVAEISGLYRDVSKLYFLQDECKRTFANVWSNGAVTEEFAELALRGDYPRVSRANRTKARRMLGLARQKVEFSSLSEHGFRDQRAVCRLICMLRSAITRRENAPAFYVKLQGNVELRGLVAQKLILTNPANAGAAHDLLNHAGMQTPFCELGQYFTNGQEFVKNLLQLLQGIR
jgi:hypothetical protein